jgi:hypothetical protein
VAIEMHGAAAHVIIDSIASYTTKGFIPARGGAFTAQAPSRLVDTRATGTPLGPGAVLQVPVVPPGSHVTAVAVNITVDQPSAAGYVTAFRSGADQPPTSNVNFAAGETTANMAIVSLGVDGAMDLFNYGGSAHVIIDLLGTYDDGTTPIAGGQLTAVPPSRLLDTRVSGMPVDSRQPLELPVVGRAGVPSTGRTGPPTAVVLNLTAAAPTAATYLTVAPSTAVPGTSNLNTAPGRTKANLVVSGLDAHGGVWIRSFAGVTQVIVDAEAYFS